MVVERSPVTNVSFTGSIGEVQPARCANISEDVPPLKLAKEILVMSIPLGLAAVAQISISVVLVAAVGRMLDVTALGGTALASGLINATAFSMASGFCGALETLLSRSYGRDPHSKLYGLYAQRMTLMLMIIAVLVAPILVYSDSLLIALKQDPAVAFYTGRFCRIAIFGIFPIMMLELLRRYFACQHLNKELSVNLIAGAVLFPPMTWCLIKLFGYAGAPLSWALVMTIMPGSLLFYIVYTGKYHQTWGGWDKAALSNWGPLLKLAIPSMAMMLSEWMSLEINAITAGWAPDVDLAAFSIVYQMSSVFWSLASGVFIEAAVLVGGALGQGRQQFARRCALYCLGIAMGFGLMDTIIAVTFRNYIPRLFTDDEAVQKKFASLIKFFALYHFFDCVQSCMMGVLRGCGLQKIGAIAVTLVYSVVGVPLGIIVFFNNGRDVWALWMGPAVGVSLVGFPIYCYLFFYHIKWDDMAPVVEDLPSMHSSEDARSLAEGTATPKSATTEEEEGVRGTPDWRRRRGATSSPHTAPSSPESHHTGGVENFSFASLNQFHIPQRTILGTPGFYTGAECSTPSRHASPPPVELLPPAMERFGLLGDGGATERVAVMPLRTSSASAASLDSQSPPSSAGTSPAGQPLTNAPSSDSD